KLPLTRHARRAILLVRAFQPENAASDLRARLLRIGFGNQPALHLPLQLGKLVAIDSEIVLRLADGALPSAQERKHHRKCCGKRQYRGEGPERPAVQIAVLTPYANSRAMRPFGVAGPAAIEASSRR